MMDPDLAERDRLYQLDKEMERFDEEGADPVQIVADIVERYRNLGRIRRTESPLWQWPLWQLVQDIQRQATVYTNIIEQLKSGSEDASDVKTRFEATFGLIQAGTLPNPSIDSALEKAFKKVSRFGTTMIILIRDFGQSLIRDELQFGEGEERTATLQVQLSFTGPGVTLGTEYTRVSPGALQPPPSGQ